MPDEQLVYDQFKLINERLTNRDLLIMKYAVLQKDFFSQNNSAYWLRKNILELVHQLTVSMEILEAGIFQTIKKY